MSALDPVLTVVLLVLGLINTTQTVAQSRDLGAMLDALFVREGIGDYTNTQAAAIGGGLLALVSVVCLVLAIGFSVPRLRQRRRAAWIPLVCAAIGLLMTAVVVGGAAAADPAFSEYVRSRI